MNKNRYLTILLGFIFSVVAAAEMNVPIQLKLKSPGGSYPTESGLSFKLVILTPATGCILREEDFSSQTITNGNVSLNLGSGVRGVSDPSLTLNQVYDNSKTKTGLTCVDANNSIVSSGQSYIPAASDGRIIRVLTAIGGDPVLANFNMRATPYAIQAESVGGKSASDLIVKDVSSQLNQTNLNDLLQDVTRFNNLKSIALSGQAASATTATTAANFSGALAGDVSGTQGATNVNKIKGVAVSATAPVVGQVLQYDGTQYVPSNLASGSVVSVAGKSGIVTLVSSDISGFGDAAGMNVGSTAGTVAAGNDSRLLSAYADTLNATSANTASTLVKRDASGNIAATNILSSNNSTNNLYLYDGANSLRLKAPAGLAANYILTLPADDGTLGQLLQTDGSGNLTWVTGSGGGGTVMDVTASAPLASSGGTNPNLTITQASPSSAGFLSSTDWTTFNSKQNNLGFTPLDAAFFNASVASSSCTTTQSLYWNSVSSQFLCQNISFPADAVTTVAGRTGAVVLASSDVSGLGTAAGFNVGVSAGNIVQLDGAARIPDSTLPTNALTTSSVYSGDVSGTSTTMSVNRLRGVAVSATAPVTGQALVYNGSNWVPTTGFPTFSRSVANQTFSSVTVANVTSLSFAVVSGVTYKYKFNIMYTSAATSNGLRLGLTYPTVTSASGLANIASGADGTGAYFQGLINASGDSVMAANSPSAIATLYAQVEGLIVPSAAGTMQLQAATEVAASNIVILAGSFVEVVVIP